jgi:Zn-dependent peptidase ImmA (M78 family)
MTFPGESRYPSFENQVVNKLEKYFNARVTVISKAAYTLFYKEIETSKGIKFNQIQQEKMQDQIETIRNNYTSSIKDKIMKKVLLNGWMI